MLQRISGARWVPRLACPGPATPARRCRGSRAAGAGAGEAAGVEDQESGDPTFQVEGGTDQLGVPSVSTLGCAVKGAPRSSSLHVFVPSVSSDRGSRR